MSDKITVKLFSAKWCHFCKDFSPTWDILQKNNGHNELLKIVNFETYEETERKNDYNIDNAFENYEIKSYPTIIIEKDGKYITYTGSRDKETLKNYFIKIANEGIDNYKKDDVEQKGGSINYKYKYEKYKSKYEALKKKYSK